MPLLSEIVDEFMADLSTPRTRYPLHLLKGTA